MKNYRLLDACENCKWADWILLDDSGDPAAYCSYENPNLNDKEAKAREVKPNGKCDNWEGE